MTDAIFQTTAPAARQRLVQRTDATKLPFTMLTASLVVSTSTVLAVPLAPTKLIAIQGAETKHYAAANGVEGFAECSTEPFNGRRPATDVVESVMQLGHGTYFEDGVETTFSLQLVEAIKCGGDAIIDSLENLVMFGRADEVIAAEAFRWIGGLEDARTHQSRWRFLVSALQYSSLTLRDGALMGLAAMGDRRSLPYLSKALVKPENGMLRRDIETLIQQLQ